MEAKYIQVTLNTDGTVETSRVDHPKAYNSLMDAKLELGFGWEKGPEISVMELVEELKKRSSYE